MKTSIAVSQSELLETLLNVATVRPVFIWGAPGIGKSSIVEQFAEQVGLPCVTLLGSQLAPEDIAGVPKIDGHTSIFCPPRLIARPEPYCLFLDELNACTAEVQKAFYSLINDRRVGEYVMPEGSVVIGAGNRAHDSAIVRQMSSALINRMVHVHLTVSHRDWLAWAHQNAIHPWVIEYIQNRPDHLWSEPGKTEETFSTPRSWHMLSDCLKNIAGEPRAEQLEVLAFGCLTTAHAVQFKAFIKQLRNKFGFEAIFKGDKRWPSEPTDRDILYFLSQSFRAHLFKHLPDERTTGGAHTDLVHRSKGLLKDLAAINFEMAQMVVAADDEKGALPSWFMAEVVRDLPRLVVKR